jgi:hypothetical protein
LKRPAASRDKPTDAGIDNRAPAALAPAAVKPLGTAEGLRDLLEEALWPIVERAFRDAADEVEGRFFQLADMQVVVSRAPVRHAVNREAERVVTLEVWPAAGPRLLVIEWSGRRPYVVHWRDGNWLPRLVAASRQWLRPAG